MAEKDDDTRDDDTKQGGPESDAATVKPAETTAAETDTSPDDVIQRLGLVNRAALKAVPHSKEQANDNIVPFVRPELDEATTVDLLARCAEMFPEHADKLPSFEGLKALVTRLVNGWEAVLELNKGLSNKRYTKPERHTLLSAAESIGEPKFIADIFNRTHEIYARILSLAPLFQSKNFGNLINDDFTLNQVAMTQIADVVVEVLTSYENLRIQANTHSTTVAEKIKHREAKYPGESLDEDKSILMRAHRWNKMIVNLQAQGVFTAMKNGDIQSATANLAKAIETTFFVASEYLGMAFAPQISKNASGKFAFENHAPFKADYLMYLMTTLFELIPALRVQMHIFSRIQKWDPRMAELSAEKTQSEKPKLN